MPLHIGANRATINPAATSFSPYGAICKASSQNPGTRFTAAMWSVLADMARERFGGTGIHPLIDINDMAGRPPGLRPAEPGTLN